MSDLKLYLANRVVQLDAKLLDKSLMESFSIQLDEIFRTLFYKNSSLQVQYHKGKHFLLAAYYILQIISEKSPGQHLLNLYFYKMKKSNAWINYFFGLLIPSVINILVASTKSLNIQMAAEKLIALFNFTEFIHFYYFLNKGGSSNLFERLFNLRTSYQTQPAMGLINYEGLNKELIGHGFGHLCVLIAPIFQLLRYKTKNFFKMKPTVSSNTLLICDQCNQVAIMPVNVQRRDKKNHNFNLTCYYCFYLNQSLYSNMKYFNDNNFHT